MQRIELIQRQFHSPHSPQTCNYLTQIMWQRRNQIIHAFQPHLNEFAKELVRQQYSKILTKIIEARTLFKDKFNLIKKEPQDSQKASGLTVKIWSEFRSCLEDKLHEIISGILNELSDKLAKKLYQIPDTNLIARSVRIYSSVMGSYQQKLTFLQKLSPNILTLSYIEKEILQRSGDRELSSSIWVLLYIFSFAFVQMFRKYITRQQKMEVLRIIKFTFVRNLSIVAGSIQLSEQQMLGNRFEVQQRVDTWIEEITKITY